MVQGNQIQYSFNWFLQPTAGFKQLLAGINFHVGVSLRFSNLLEAVCLFHVDSLMRAVSIFIV